MSQQERTARRAGKVVLAIYGKYEKPVGEFVAKMGATCRDGCSHCCMLPASTTIPEMVPVVDHLVGRTDWPELKPKLERLIRQNLLAMSSVDLSDKAQRDVFFKSKVPCIFLEDGRCSIYEVRPAVCRYHYVVSPPENCSPLALDDRIARINLTKIEDLVTMTGAHELGAMTGATLAAALVLAADMLGVKLDVDRDMVRRNVMMAVPVGQGSGDPPS